MSIRLDKIILIIILFFILQINAKPQAQISLDSIINNHLKIIGFSNGSDGIKDFSLEGQLMQKNISFPISIKGIIPDRLRMDMIFNQKTFVKISNESTAWEYNPLNDSLSTGKCQKDEALSFLNRLCGSMVKYKAGKATIRDLGLTTVDDIEVYKLEIKENEKSQVYYIDKYSYLIVRIDDDFVENKITYYSDYRKTGNYFVPFNITGYENGIPIMSMKFTNIKINTGIQSTVFSKPK